jgi:hypothetical protein
MPLVTQAAYARHRGISPVSVFRRTVKGGGPIPTYGPKKLIDVAEADALWEATKSPQGVANTAARLAAAAAASTPDPAAAAAGVSGADLTRARAAALVVDVQTKRLLLERTRGALISRDRATLKAFAFARTLRDACMTWPARIGPQLAAAFDLDAAAVTVYLEDHVRQLLIELASERVDF